MNILSTHYTHLILLLFFGLLFHAILWARNRRFLWQQRRTILTIVALAELWMLITDPIGGHWGAWYFSPEKLLGIYFWEVMPLEDFLGIAIVSSTAASATLVFAYRRGAGSD